MPPIHDDRAPVRVLVITGNAIVGGMESAVLRLAQRLPRDDFPLTALCPFESAFTAALRDAHVAVHIVPVGETLRWHAIQFAVELVREHGIGVIHAHMPAAHALGALAGRITHTPVLATIHAMHVSMWDFEAHRLARTHLCVVSEAARAHALALGVAPESLSVIRNGVDSECFVPRPGALSRDREAGATVGYVGRLSPEKHPALFLRAAALVHARRPATRFVVIGDGPLRADLESLAARLRIDHVVRFEGECSDMPTRYQGLDVLLCPSWEEGTPLAVLEAMACAIPVVATEVGGVPELVVAGATGWLVPVGDEAAMAQRTLALLEAPTTMHRFGRAARERARTRFSLDEQASRTASLLERLAHDAARSRERATRPTVAAHRNDAASAG